MDKLKEVDWRGIYKTASAKVKKYTLNLTDLELKVEDATNSETWGEARLEHACTRSVIAHTRSRPGQHRHASTRRYLITGSGGGGWRRALHTLTLQVIHSNATLFPSVAAGPHGSVMNGKAAGLPAGLPCPHLVHARFVVCFHPLMLTFMSDLLPWPCCRDCRLCL